MPEREDLVRKLLKLPGHVSPFSIIPVGHPTGVDQPKNKFTAEKVHWEEW
jgi:hypothetical protein